MMPETAAHRHSEALVFTQLNFNEYNESALWGSAMTDALREKESSNVLVQHNWYTFMYISSQLFFLLHDFNIGEERQHVPGWT